MLQLLLFFLVVTAVSAFLPTTPRTTAASAIGQKSCHVNNNPFTKIYKRRHDETTTTTGRIQSYVVPSLSTRGQRHGRGFPLFEGIMMNLPPYFFTVTFPLLYLTGNAFQHLRRQRLEERAWEQRLDEEREKKLANDPTLSEIELRKQEAAAEWSPYGPDAMLEREREKEYARRIKNNRRRVKLMEEDDEDDGNYYNDDDEDDYRRSPTEFGMTDDEIAKFEREFNISYDPYYDDPYTEEELPDDISYNVDKKYGDRIYENGEIFYKDSETGLYYRQGSRPRIRKLFDF